MNAAVLTAWLVSQATVLDFNGHPIPRPQKAVDVIVTAALGTGAPYLFAAWLDVLAAHESGYKPSLAGDCPGMKAGSLLCTRERGAHACGAWQGLCASLPASATVTDQAKLAVKDLMRAIDGCPNHPLWMYAAGHCSSTRTAVLYEADVARELAHDAPLASAEP